jgi:hypothetical protein
MYIYIYIQDAAPPDFYMGADQVFKTKRLGFQPNLHKLLHQTQKRAKCPTKHTLFSTYLGDATQMPVCTGNAILDLLIVLIVLIIRIIRIIRIILIILVYLSIYLRNAILLIIIYLSISAIYTQTHTHTHIHTHTHTHTHKIYAIYVYIYTHTRT